jgi:RNA polymerase sigma-70 factor (ECF subfamily)
MTAEQFNYKLVGVQQKMLNYALTLTSDSNDAQDLLQETNYRALSAQDKFMIDTNFSAWMYTIMRNSFINGYRRKFKMKQSPSLVDEIGYLSNMYYTDETPEMLRSVDEVHQMMNTMESEFKDPLKMHMQGYKYKDIAEQLDMPIGTVKSRIFFGRKKLSKLISQ